MKNKPYLLIILLSPFKLFSQEIQCIDTVTQAGYFFELTIRNGVMTTSSFREKYKNKYYFFLAEKDLNNKTLTETAKKLLFSRDVDSEDTIKYLSYRPDTMFYWKYLQGSCLDIVNRVIDIDSIVKDNKFYRLKKIKKYVIQLSYVKVLWVHLRVLKKVACEEYLSEAGLNKPPTLYCEYRYNRYFDIYLPLKLIERNNDVKIKGKSKIINRVR